MAAQIDPPIKSPAGSLAHHLAVIYVSDYHVMDCPLTIHGVDCGLFAIDDHDRTRTSMPAMKVMTSLNHTVHFHVHDGFRADELMYIEVSSPWARDGRAMVHSRIFSHQGVLVATCVQEVCTLLCVLYSGFHLQPHDSELFRLTTFQTGFLCVQRQCEAVGVAYGTLRGEWVAW